MHDTTSPGRRFHLSVILFEKLSCENLYFKNYMNSLDRSITRIEFGNLHPQICFFGVYNVNKINFVNMLS